MCDHDEAGSRPGDFVEGGAESSLRSLIKTIERLSGEQ